MAPHISNELRDLIIFWRFSLHINVAEIAALARRSERRIYDVLRWYREYGTLVDPAAQHHTGQKPLLDHEDREYIQSILKANPVLHLEEIHQKLFEGRGVDVCIPTISRALRDLLITNKKVSYHALQRNELLRATWIGEYGDIPKEYIVWLDESGVDGQDYQRTHGWSELGLACVSRTTFL